MPSYDYICPECRNIQVFVHGFDEVNDKKCDECGVVLRKKFGAVPASFKGDGFYTTDRFN